MGAGTRGCDYIRSLPLVPGRMQAVVRRWWHAMVCCTRKRVPTPLGLWVVLGYLRDLRNRNLPTLRVRFTCLPAH